jgi:aspartyl-tRNA(Asn)/glutamyl-tRNA(Gln) amidotransferase subunit A
MPNDVDWLGCLGRDIEGSRIAYCPAWGGFEVDPQIAALAEAAARAFASDLGCHVEQVAMPWENPVRPFRTLIALDSDLKGMRALVARHGAKISPNIVALMGIEWTAEMFTDALAFRKSVANVLWRLMQRFDFLITPTTNALPPPADKAPGAVDYERPLPVFTCVANMTGNPAASLPAGWTREGLPVGIQIVGRHLADARVLAACAAFERARPWRDRWPPGAA